MRTRSSECLDTCGEQVEAHRHRGPQTGGRVRWKADCKARPIVFRCRLSRSFHTLRQQAISQLLRTCRTEQTGRPTPKAALKKCENSVDRRCEFESRWRADDRVHFHRDEVCDQQPLHRAPRPLASWLWSLRLILTQPPDSQSSYHNLEP